MTANLVIVESPTKAKMLQRFLGKEYTVMSSYGHIRDLPNKKSELPPSQRTLPHASLAIDIENDFAPLYVIPEKSRKHASALKKAFQKDTTLYLASDEDREGEAISWHLMQILKPKKTNAVHRVVFHEITKDAILKAFQKPRELHLPTVEAQQARRVLDRLVGYELSPLLWQKIRPGLSAGRVQSVALRLIVEREREIEAFIPEESWSITAHLEHNSSHFRALLTHLPPEKKKASLKNEDDAKEALERLKGASFSVAKVEEKPRKRRAAPPFTTSTLQQEASRKLGYGVRRTMGLAQELYEGIEAGGEAGGLITYMRTDSVNLASRAIAEAQEVITKEYGKEYSDPRQYKGKSAGAQEAHEAIRPTNLKRTPQSLKNIPESTLSSDAKKLYELIWKRTIASQMSDAKLMGTSVDLEAQKNGEVRGVFRATGQVVTFPGFLKVYEEGRDDSHQDSQESLLPALREGDTPLWLNYTPEQHFTKPPARYTEASLVKALEANGIGRPSTYAPTVSTLLTREYVTRGDSEGNNRRSLYPSDIGKVVSDFLVEYFPRIVDIPFTAEMEKALDDVATEQIDWQEYLKKFYQDFHQTVVKGKDIPRSAAKQERLLGTHPETGLPIYAKLGRYGPMLQMGETESEDKPKFASLMKGQKMESVTLEEALPNFSLPRVLGEGPEGEEVRVNVGRFGPYVQWQKTYVSITEEELFSLDLEEGLLKIQEKREAQARALIHDWGDVQVKEGRYGPYVTNGKKNGKIPKDTDPQSLTEEEAREILEKAPEKKGRTRKTTKATTAKKAPKKKASTRSKKS